MDFSHLFNPNTTLHQPTKTQNSRIPRPPYLLEAWLPTLPKPWSLTHPQLRPQNQRRPLPQPLPLSNPPKFTTRLQSVPPDQCPSTSTRSHCMSLLCKKLLPSSKCYVVTTDRRRVRISIRTTNPTINNIQERIWARIQSLEGQRMNNNSRKLGSSNQISLTSTLLSTTWPNSTRSRGNPTGPTTTRSLKSKRPTSPARSTFTTNKVFPSW